MRRFLTAVGCAALMLPLLPTTGAAQDMPEQGDLGMLMFVEVAPAHRSDYREAIENLNEAAEAAGVSDYEWHFWSTDTGYTLYYPIEAFAYFDDPQQLWRSFEGTDGQTGRDEFFAAMQAIPSHSSTEVIESIPSLTYWPEDFDDVNSNHVHQEWLADGASEEDWVEMGKEWIAFLELIDYPYGAVASRTRIGDERMTWVFFAPSLSEFHSDANWDDLIEAANAGDRLSELNEKWGSIVGRMEHHSSGYVESMSYTPDDM